MPDITNIFSFFQSEGLVLIFKVLLLLLLFVFIIFSFIVVNRVKTLNKAFYLHGGHASASVQIASVVILFAAISLFIITLVIV